MGLSIMVLYQYDHKYSYKLFSLYFLLGSKYKKRNCFKIVDFKHLLQKWAEFLPCQKIKAKY